MLQLPIGSHVQGRLPRTRIRRLESLDRCAKTAGGENLGQSRRRRNYNRRLGSLDRYAEPAVAEAPFRYICKEHGFEGLETWIDMLKPLGGETVVRTVGEENELIDSEAWGASVRTVGQEIKVHFYR